MAQQITSYRVFIASPGGLNDERDSFYQSIDQFNDADAYERDLHFKAVGWKDTQAGHGRPQALINKELRLCDYFVLILHDRWGYPPSLGGKYTSGTEEEFQEALLALNDENMPMAEMILLFKEVSQAKLADPGPQLSQVLAFKKEREEKRDFMYKTFDSLDEFNKILQFALSNWVRQHETSGNTKSRFNMKIKNISTQFKTTETNWLHEVIVNDNWELALVKADESFKSGKIVEADMIYSQIFLRSNDPRHIAEYGRYLRKQFRLYIADEVLRKSIEMSITAANRSCQAFAQRQLGRVYEFKGEFNKAMVEFQTALEIFEQIGDSSGKARTLIDMGFAQSKMRNSQKGIEELNKAVAIYKRLKDNVGLGTAFGYLTVIYKDTGNIDMAEKFSNKALSEFSKSTKIDKSEVYIIKGNLGVIKRIKGKLAEAEALHREALDYFLTSSDARAKAREYCNLGVVYRLNANYVDAIQLHEKALEFEEQTLNVRGKAFQLANIGLNYLELGERDRAEAYLKEALSINIRLKDEKCQSIQLKNLARLFISAMEYDRAEQKAKESLALDLASSNQIGIADCYFLLGKIARHHKDWETARTYYELALSIYTDFNHEKMIELLKAELSNLGSSAK